LQFLPLIHFQLQDFVQQQVIISNFELIH